MGQNLQLFAGELIKHILLGGLAANIAGYFYESAVLQLDD